MRSARVMQAFILTSLIDYPACQHQLRRGLLRFAQDDGVFEDLESPAPRAPQAPRCEMTIWKDDRVTGERWHG